MLASRGITQRYRHLMEDVLTLLPHSVKDNKFDQVMLPRRLRSNSTVRTNTTALALLATSLRAVVNAKITGRRALPALVLDFVVWANVWAVALSTHCVSKARILQDDHV